jgi:hypothetical protein
MTKQQTKLAHYVDVYRREIHSGTHRQCTAFHEIVLADAIAAMNGTPGRRTVNEAIVEIEDEMVILRHSQKGRLVSFPIRTSRKEAMKLLEAAA